MKKKICINLIALAICFLGAYEGNLALWLDGASKPSKVFPYSVKIFPWFDQSKLEKGIRILNHEELTRLLEDFTS